MGSGDVCPTSARLLAFARDDGGSVARMAVVRAEPVRRLVVGRYVVGPKIAGGGMATVHLGRQRGGAGFARTVAIKRLLPELAKDPELAQRFVDEARIASRIRHANVVPTLDVVNEPEVLLVLEYVHGESLARMLRLAIERGERCPPPIASAIVVGVLRGLHGAHQAKGSNGVALELVHRDVSPQNVIVGADGVPRVLDFGIAKAAGREQSTLNKGSTRDLRGKLAYMAPEQVAGEPLDRRADLFAAGVILWETLACERLFKGEDAVRTMEAVFHREPPQLAKDIAGVSARVDEVLATALAKDAAQRFATADEMARAIEIALPPGSDREVADWVEKIAGETLAARTAVIAEFEGSTDGAGEDEPEDDPNDPTTLKRGAALLPPALPGAIPPNMRDSAPTLSAEPIRTPMAMVTPAATPAIDPLAKSGMTETRVGPIGFDPRRPKPFASPRTPIPIPMPASPAKPRMSAIQVAALVLLPPAVAALSLLVIRPAATASAASSPPPPVAMVAPSEPVPPIPSATTPTATPATPAVAPPAHPVAPAAPVASSASAARAPRYPRVPQVRPPRKR